MKKHLDSIMTASFWVWIISLAVLFGSEPSFYGEQLASEKAIGIFLISIIGLSGVVCFGCYLAIRNKLDSR